MSRRGAIVSAAVAAAGSLLPHAALACAVCFGSASSTSRKAFFDMTILMTVLPLVVMAAGLAWLAYKAKAFLASEFVESPDAIVPPAEGANSAS